MLWRLAIVVNFANVVMVLMVVIVSSVVRVGYGRSCSFGCDCRDCYCCYGCVWCV